MLSILRNFINGLAVGIVETVPGVSGGTIAIILGFYFDLINAINNFTKNLGKHLALIIPLAIGVAAGILLFSSLMNFLLEYYSFPTMLFLIGLITGIIPHIAARVRAKDSAAEAENRDPSLPDAKPDSAAVPFRFVNVIVILIPFLFIVALSFIRKDASDAAQEEIMNSIGTPYMIFIFFAGILAAAALVIPGISGSFVLLLMGVYPVVIFAVSSIRIYFSDTSDIALLINICKVLAPLAAGVVIGGLCMVRLIGILLTKYSRVVYSIILGLLLGSIFALFRDPIVYKSGVSAIIIVIGIVAFALGAFASYFLGKKKL